MDKIALKKGMSHEDIEELIGRILEELSLEEKVYMMSGRGFVKQITELDNRRWGARTYQAGAGNERLGIPTLQFSDGPRGIVTKNSTCFPVSMARGATWDVALEERIGDVIGKELRAHRGNLYGGVCINLLRHPAWGRAQETYGEDTYQLGEFGAALVRGVQKHNVIATAKHFTANSIENARFKVNVKIDERSLREIYLPHFKRCVDEGVGSVMSAYNKVNGEYCGQNERLLKRILKEEWDFGGFVHSDWLSGVYAPYGAAHGLDIENPEPQVFGEKLVKAVEDGAISPHTVDGAVRRILRVLFRFMSAEDPLPQYNEDLVACPEHVDLAREAAEKSMVLLKNDGALLPFKKERVSKIAVIGELANIENTGDRGSSWARPPSYVTYLDGIKSYLEGDTEVLFDDGTDVEASARKAAEADVAVVVVGYTHEHEGEYIQKEELGDQGGDRDSLSLTDQDVKLLQAVGAANSKTVAVVVAGSAVIMEEWRGQAAAIIMAWYAGMVGGEALPRLLFGDVSPSGKLPCTFPKSSDQLPFFDKNAEEIEYSFYHGYNHFDHEEIQPAFPFGFGLSYTTFGYSNLELSNDEVSADGRLEVFVDITNSGEIEADEAYQMYVGCADSAVERHEKDLKGFGRVSLKPGETKTVKIHLLPKDLAYYDVEQRAWIVESATYSVYVGPSSDACGLLKAEFRVV